MRWFLPDQVARPKHFPLGGMRASVGVIAGLSIGGSTDGIPEDAWTWAPDGWAFFVCPGDTPRARASIIEGSAEVKDGAGNEWLVPVLLEQSPHGLRCALPCTWTGDGFNPPAFAEQAIDDLCAFAADPVGNESQGPVLACLLLSMNYHLSHHEIIAAGWLTDRAILRILLAACGADYHGAR